MLNSAVAAYYCLRIIVMMYMQEPSDAAPELPASSPGFRLAMFAAAVAIFLGVFPSSVLDFASKSAAPIR